MLVIDDDPAVLRAYLRILSPPHEIVAACGGAEGLVKLEDVQTYDVILCDLMMPGVDGSAIYDAIKASAPDRVPRLVFCSGGAFTERGKLLMATLDNVFLEKPASRQDLLRVIERVMESGQAK